MPVRARSRIFHRGDACLPRSADRLAARRAPDRRRRESSRRRARAPAARRRASPQCVCRTSARGRFRRSGCERVAPGGRSRCGRAGSSASDCLKATRSRGPAVPSDTRAIKRSRSCTPLSASRSFAARGASEREILDGVEPILNARRAHQGTNQPRADHPAAHRASPCNRSRPARTRRVRRRGRRSGRGAGASPDR